MIFWWYGSLLTWMTWYVGEDGTRELEQASKVVTSGRPLLTDNGTLEAAGRSFSCIMHSLGLLAFGGLVIGHMKYSDDQLIRFLCMLVMGAFMGRMRIRKYFDLPPVRPNETSWFTEQCIIAMGCEKKQPANSKASKAKAKKAK